MNERQEPTKRDPAATCFGWVIIERLRFWFWWFGNDEAHPGFGVRIVRFLEEEMLGTPVRHRGVCVDFPGIMR